MKFMKNIKIYSHITVNLINFMYINTVSYSVILDNVFNHFNVLLFDKNTKNSTNDGNGKIISLIGNDMMEKSFPSLEMI